MNQIFKDRLSKLSSKMDLKYLAEIRRGFEKECLRVDEQKNLSEKPHPKALGSSLTHPYITTDYGEALLELITPPLDDFKASFKFLTDLHHFTYHILDKEFLWASSMPCRLPEDKEIAIAQYGSSNLGQLKHIYRRGLGYRYGRRMQTIAGIHYNFSFSDSFWENYHALLQSREPLKQFISDQYLGIIRNCLRFGWLLPLLFGASPGLNKTFLQHEPPDFLESWDNETLVSPYATSLRLSDLGYHNKTQSTLNISYNSLAEFLETMHSAVHTPVPEYTRIGVFKNGQYNQLSDCVLQIEDEHYGMVRPKRVILRGERLMHALTERGIEYIEVRALDIDPFLPLGIDETSVYFLDIFLTTCLLLESPLLDKNDKVKFQENHARVVKWGRKPNLTLISEEGNERLMKEWALDFLANMQDVAKILDEAYKLDKYQSACKEVQQRLHNPDILSSARVLADMKEHQGSYSEFVSRWSHNHQKHFLEKSLLKETLDYYVQLAEDSLNQQGVIEHSDDVPFAEYLRQYLII